MSKSIDYVVDKFNVNKELITEYPSEKIFDEYLGGRRGRTQVYKNGIVHIKIDFDDTDFNHQYTWSGKRDGWADDIKDELDYAAGDVLFSKAIMPVEDGKPLGGDICPTDCIEYTFGNFVVEDHVYFENGKFKEEARVYLPFKYQRMVGDG